VTKYLFPALALAGALNLPALAADPHTITMTGHGEVKAVPDIAIVNAGVTINASTAAAALSANNARMNQLFDALKKLGIPDRNIQTTGFSVSPQYSNGDSNSPRRLTGYQANNQVTVRLTDVSRTGSAIDTLAGAGANQMYGIGFDIAAPAPLLEKARGQAIADARTRAQTYAQAAGVTLGPVLSISEGNGEASPRPLYRAMALAAPVPVAPGEQSVTADVTVVWEIH
jgi:uncharacterized protein YggE